jgi:replicative superfamily II helicase
VIPSLVAWELREALVEYLATTFALSDDETRAELAGFLADPDDGIFRGPYLQVRTPFRMVPDSWVSPLDWLPEGFRPYVHQAQAFERLTSRDHEPEPTLVTSSTGSGKTEAFLYPILDHCARERDRGRRGIKALLLYPMNALAGDQARRLARLLHKEPGLAGITAGIYIGEQAGQASAGPDQLVGDRDILRRSPPDILLTNYKMLDLLLLRRADRELWTAGERGTLRYVVLDEFHTYDGAQGTDVAMLLRRLGARLGQAEGGRPLGPVTPVATSATLGAGTTAGPALREFAERVFGVPFGEDAVVEEQRQTPDEACGTVDYTLPIPDVEELLEVPERDLDGAASLFTGRVDVDPVELGDLLLHHPMTRAVLAAAGDRSRSWTQAVELLVIRAPSWGAVAQQDLPRVEEALARYLALLSVARRANPDGGKPSPLFAVEVQIWVREVSRLLRMVAAESRFRWFDSAASEPEQDIEEVEPERHVPELPAAYCRHCGRAGWMAFVSELDGSLVFDPTLIYRASAQQPARVRALLRASPAELDARHLDPATRRLQPQAGEGTIPVLATPDEAAARRQTCPSCDQDDGVRFLGARVASLASVCVSQLFGSPLVNAEERKLLAFTDSVQDAAHRAAFFSGRTYRFNLRTLMAEAVEDAEQLSLQELGESLLEQAGGDPGAVHALTPPDLLDHPQVRTLWTGRPESAGRELLATRLAFEAALELGLRARVGRTLELTGTVAAAVEPQHSDALADLIEEAHRHLTGQGVLDTGLPGYEAYLRGLLERLRLRGGILHPWLEPYLAEEGNHWRIWGGRPDGMLAFPPGQSRPTFPHDRYPGVGGAFDSLAANGATPTWLVDWAARTLGVDPPTAQALNRRTFELLAAAEVVHTRPTRRGGDAYGLDPAVIAVHDVPTDAGAPSLLRCGVCRSPHAAPPWQLAVWAGAPCLRYRCAGRYQPAPAEPSNYYRRLYRSRTRRRVVTAEHTGLLDRRDRERLESSFKAGSDPAAPNVVVCTPTLELGIDIGDLSAVLLTSIPRGPAAYVQRVGRAGRLTGNAFVGAFLPAGPRALSFLAQPEQLLAGEVRPPSCYLDAVEILRRQFFAYLVDLAAEGTLPAPQMPPKIGAVTAAGRKPGSWLGALVDPGAVADGARVDEFLALFAGQLREETTAGLRAYAVEGLPAAVDRMLDRWQERYDDLVRRRDRLRTSIERLEQRPDPDDPDRRELRRLRGERHAVIVLLRELREEPTLQALEALGLLPNYTLLDDAATLEAVLWTQDRAGRFDTAARLTYRRPAAVALSEFAPGNSFYAHQRRLVIDGLEVGSASEPLYQWWRLCPECAFGAPEASQPSWVACPRCRHPGIADSGARHLLLELRRVFTSDADERTRVLDETDERERRHYQVLTTVDVDPDAVERAWLHTAVTFGMEYATAAIIRSVNFGLAGRHGDQVRVAGEPLAPPRFRTCRYCGAVVGARQPIQGSHRGWCLTRSGRNETWDDPVLYHQVETEAVRLLMPVATFEIAERLASFKAALLLGLRLDFGGEPQHLKVVASDFPGSGGPGRRRFLVLHDTVPGGTGYLGRIADPERLRTILDRARSAIARCPCRGEGRAACHRCLLGGVEPQEIELVSRGLALELLDQLLEAWSFDRVPTLTEADIGGVEESELERRFRAALHDWAELADSAATLTRRPAGNGGSAMELRLGSGPTTRRYLIEEQRGLDTIPPTRPDYLITRQDGPALQVAVYLDGYQFHASPDHNRLADDAAKRRAVRDAGTMVWNLTWQDVQEFHEACSGRGVQRQPPDRRMLEEAGRLAARQTHGARGADGPEVAVADHNPMRQLLEFLTEPDLAGWERVALSAIAGAVRTAGFTRHPPEAAAALLQGALTGDPMPAGDDGSILAGRLRRPPGLRLTFLLDGRAEAGGPNAERWTALAVLDDHDHQRSTIEDRKAAWPAWLQWANLLQFLTGDGRAAVVAASSEADRFDPTDFELVPSGDREEPPPAGPPAPRRLSPEAVEELELILDPAARDLVEEVLANGAPVPVAGFEPEAEAAGWVVEVAWPERRVAVLTDADADRDAWLHAHGWDARPTSAWTTASLTAALQGRA